MQIYVEVERAHLTLELAKMKEEEGDIEEAARVLQELQVSVGWGGCCAVLGSLYRLDLWIQNSGSCSDVTIVF